MFQSFILSTTNSAFHILIASFPFSFHSSTSHSRPCFLHVPFDLFIFPVFFHSHIFLQIFVVLPELWLVNFIPVRLDFLVQFYSYHSANSPFQFLSVPISHYIPYYRVYQHGISNFYFKFLQIGNIRTIVTPNFQYLGFISFVFQATVKN